MKNSVVKRYWLRIGPFNCTSITRSYVSSTIYLKANDACGGLVVAVDLDVRDVTYCSNLHALLRSEFVGAWNQKVELE